MTLKQFVEKAQATGENLKEEIFSELLGNQFVRDVLANERFSKAVSRIIQTKKEVIEILRENVRNILQVMDVPTRSQVNQLQNKVGQLEKMVDRVGKKAILVKSLKNLQHRKAAKKKK